MVTFKASKSAVEADTIKRGTRTKHHQTNTHNAQTRVAKGDVEVRVLKQYPTRIGNSERPPAGSKFHGDDATISSRKVTNKASGSKRALSVFDDDVTVNLKKKASASSQKKMKPKRQVEQSFFGRQTTRMRYSET